MSVHFYLLVLAAEDFTQDTEALCLCHSVSAGVGTKKCRDSVGWLHGTVAERRSLASELSLPCTRPLADG